MCAFESYANANAISTKDNDDAKEAAKQLARLVERGLGYGEGHIDPVALRLFLRAYWDRVTKFAHAIHDAAV